MSLDPGTEDARDPSGSFADAMFPPSVVAAGRASALAVRCPNVPPCGHSGLLHDIYDYDDPQPRCCVDPCPCGLAASPRNPEETPR